MTNAISNNRTTKPPSPVLCPMIIGEVDRRRNVLDTKLYIPICRQLQQ